MARPNQRKVEQHACLFQDYKNIRSSSEWSLFEPRVFLYTATRRVRFTEYSLRPVYTGDFCRPSSMHFSLQLQNCTCKPGEIFSAICRRDFAGVSSMFETFCKGRWNGVWFCHKRVYLTLVNSHLGGETEN